MWVVEITYGFGAKDKPPLVIFREVPLNTPEGGLEGRESRRGKLGGVCPQVAHSDLENKDGKKGTDARIYRKSVECKREQLPE